ncbi:MAG: type I secretion C-terminal target domain-containing protein, partial [Acinetobacter sp.]|nr:type I secretion C-terminal target domain-containing protein [Acinetobacter sp.]
EAEAKKALDAAKEALNAAIKAAEDALKSDADPVLDGAERDAVIDALLDAKDKVTSTDPTELLNTAKDLEKVVNDAITAEKIENALESGSEENTEIEVAKSALEAAIKKAENALKSDANPMLDGAERVKVTEALSVAKDARGSDDLVTVNNAAVILVNKVDSAIADELIELQALKELTDAIKAAKLETYSEIIQVDLDKAIAWAEKVANRDSSTTAELKEALVDLQNAIVTAEEQENIVPDTVAPEITIDLLDLTNNNQPLITGTASDESDLGIFVEIKDAADKVIDSGIALYANGIWQFKPSKPLGDATYTITAKAVDTAGNETTAKPITVQIDTQKPEGLVVQLSADTATPDDGVTSNGTVLVKNVNEDAIWEYSVNGGVSWTQGAGNSFTLKDGQYTNVLVRQKDAAGNTETVVLQPSKITIDTDLPEITNLAFSKNNSTVSGITEPGTTVKITLDGNSIGEAKADAMGKFVYSFETIYKNGETFQFEAIDIAGNKVNQAGVANKLTNLATLSPASNYEVMTPNITPTIRQPDGKTENILKSEITGFTVVNAGLGDVLNADVLSTVLSSSIGINVADDTIRRITFKSQAGGIAVLTEYSLYVYRLDEKTGQYVQHSVEKSWLKAALLAGTSDSLTLSLPAGKYIAFLAPESGVTALVGYTLFIQEDQVLDYTTAEAVNGELKGNVITDIDTKEGVDILPQGTKVSTVSKTDEKGNVVTASLGEASSTQIEGLYGTLTIYADGSYTYVIKENFDGVFGKSKDVFTYTVSAGNDSATATLEILIDNKIPESQPVIINDTIIVNPEPKMTELTGANKVQDLTSVKLLQVGLLDPILSASAIDLKDYRQFSVAENTVRELVMKGDAGGVALGLSFTLLIYRKDEVSGNYVQYHVQEDWYHAYLLGGVSEELSLTFSEGDYIARIGHSGALGLLVGSTLNFVKDTVADYGKPIANTVFGTSKKDITSEATDTIISIEGKKFTSDTLELTGKFGNLVINKDGNYTYTLNGDHTTWEAGTPYGKIESFTYIVKDKDGNVRVEELNLEIGLMNVNDQDITLTLNAKNATEQASLALVSGIKYAIDYTITVNEGFASQNAKFSFSTSSKLTEGRTITYSIFDTLKNEYVVLAIDKDGNSVYEGKITGQKTGTGVNEAIVPNLPVGIYKITATMDGFPIGAYFTDKSSYSAEVISLTQYQAADISVKGSLVTSDMSANVQSYTIGSQTISSFAGDESIQVQGKHGVLQVNKDGTYTYKASGNSAGIEEFTYFVKPVVGSSSTATLTIDVPMNIAGSTHNDQIVSSEADDIYTMNGGRDTVIFDVLDNLDHNGGNGLDTWKDFTVGDVSEVVNADLINVHELLDGNQNAGNITEYLSVKVENNNVTLVIDRDGKGENYKKADLLKLENAAFTSNKEDDILKQLLDNNQIVF